MKKISVEELHKYYEEEYGDVWPVMLGLLEGFANSGPRKEKFREHALHPFWYSEISLEYDSLRDSIIGTLRMGKSEKITCAQLKEFLRMYRLIRMFDRDYETSPDDPEEFKNFFLRHPLWPRLEKQAQKTLDALRKKS